MKKSLFTISIGLLLLTGCKDLRSERVEDPDLHQVEYKLPQGEIEYGKYGREEWFAYGALTGVDGSPGNGVAQSHYFESGHYLHTAQLNIEPAEDGYFYEGWIVKGADVVSTGHLSNFFGDTRHSLRFEDDEDYRTYLKVIVTLEPDDGNPAPAVHIAEGLLKVTPRH